MTNDGSAFHWDLDPHLAMKHVDTEMRLALRQRCIDIATSLHHGADQFANDDTDNFVTNRLTAKAYALQALELNLQ